MKYLPYAFVVILLMIATCSCDQVEAEVAVPDREMISGVWKPVKGMNGGKPMLPEFLSKIRLVISEHGDYLVEVGKKKMRGNLQVDETKKPKQMLMRPIAGPHRNITIKAVYELEKDRLRICYQPEADFFPYKLESPKNSELYLAEYKRAH